MPYINIRSSKPMNEQKKEELQSKIVEIMPTIPGKNSGNTIIGIVDSFTMYNDLKPVEAVFIDIRLYKESPEESKKEFVQKLTGIIGEVLGIPPKCVHMNFFEQANWATNGDYF